MSTKGVDCKKMDKKTNYFDKAAKTWDEKPARVELARAVTSAIRENVDLSPKFSCMEYGCGTGIISISLAPYVKRIVAVDTSRQMLKVLEEKLAMQPEPHNISTYQMDLTDGQLDSAPFLKELDLIFSSMTLHHIGPVKELLHRFYQLLRPGGWIAIADLDKEDGDFHGKDVPGVAHFGFEREEIRKLLSDIGFKEIKILTAHKMKKTTEAGVTKMFPVFLATGRKN